MYLSLSISLFLLLTLGSVQSLDYWTGLDWTGDIETRVPFYFFSYFFFACMCVVCGCVCVCTCTHVCVVYVCVCVYACVLCVCIRHGVKYIYSI